MPNDAGVGNTGADAERLITRVVPPETITPYKARLDRIGLRVIDGPVLQQKEVAQVKEKWERMAMKLALGSYPSEQPWLIPLWFVVHAIAIALLPFAVIALAVTNRIDRLFGQPNHLIGASSIIDASRAMLRIANRLLDGGISFELAEKRILRIERWAKRHEASSFPPEVGFSLFGRQLALNALQLERRRRFLSATGGA